MSEKKTSPRRSTVFGLVVTTVLSIGATIAVAWVQIRQTQEEAALAELERARSVRAAAVSIVEEHILNGKPVEISMLGRLLDLRRRQESVSIPITVLDVIEAAEYNILASRYLEFSRKEELKTVFNSLYSEVGSRQFTPYENVQNEEQLNALATAIQEGRTSEALEGLQRVVQTFQADLRTARAGSPAAFREAIEKLARDPKFFTMFVAIFTLAMIFYVLVVSPSTIRRWLLPWQTVRPNVDFQTVEALLAALEFLPADSRPSQSIFRQVIMTARTGEQIERALGKLSEREHPEREAAFLDSAVHDRLRMREWYQAEVLGRYLEKLREAGELGADGAVLGSEDEEVEPDDAEPSPAPDG